MSSESRLFVYGTLKTGQRNHGLMRGATLLGQARTVPGYTLIHLVNFPGLIPDPEAHQGVVGEIWSVSDCQLAELDDFEGVPDLFRRELVPLLGEEAETWAYYWAGELPEGATRGDCWPWN